MPEQDRLTTEMEQVAEELELTARKARKAAEHYRSGEMARGAAFTLAVVGHLHHAGRIVDDVSIAQTHHFLP